MAFWSFSHSNPQAPERILTPDLNSESCKCGSKHHKRTTHKDCPLNQKNWYIYVATCIHKLSTIICNAMDVYNSYTSI